MQTNQKGIKQFKIKCHQNDWPYKFMSPNELLKLLNEAVKGRYDIYFLECKYSIKESKDYLKFNSASAPIEKMNIDRNVNNIFSTHPELCETLFSDVVELKPPQDFDAEQFNTLMQEQKEKEDKEQIAAISKSLKFIMQVHESKNKQQLKKICTEQNIKLNTMQMFKNQFDPSNRDHQIEIYVKGKTSPSVVSKIDQQKNTKKPIEVKSSHHTLKLFLHPIGKADQMEKVQGFMDLSRITSWSLCTIPDQIAESKKFENELTEQVKHKAAEKIKGYSYFDMEKMQTKLEEVNTSIKIASNLSLRERNDVIQGFDLVSFMFNQLVLKMSLSLGQVCKISRKKTKISKYDCHQFYFHLKYPPKLFLALAKKDIAVADNYIKKWERLENFPLMRNQLIKKNDFLRLYLFNNGVLRIILIDDKTEGYSIDKSLSKMERLLDRFKGIYPCEDLTKEIDFGLTMRSFEKQFNYKRFLEFLRLEGLETNDKVWKIKYFILIMVRFNKLHPREITELLQLIEDNQDSLDIFLFIFWRTSTSIWGYQRLDMKFFEYLVKEFRKNKQLQGVNVIMKRMTENTELIAHVFRASLTPSGYLYNPPTPQMKGRLLKQFSKQSQFYLRVSICEDSQTTLKNQKYITREAFRKMMNEIHIIDRLFIPLGWSPSQLRSFSLWYMNQVHQERGEIKIMKRQHTLSFLGSFNQITNPAKKAARIGQAFSSSWTFYLKNIKINQIIERDVYSSKKYLYTDGIGKISANLIENMSLQLKLRDLSVIQMRYKGAKGVLVMDTSLPNNTIVLRDSLVKYECNHDAAKKYLDILDWNKYKPGFLNRQIIILLRTLGIENQVFIQLQKEHIKNIESLSFKDCSIFKYMHDDLNTQITNLEPANETILQMLRAGFTLQSEPFFRGVLQTLKKNGYNQLKIKSSIQVKQSARIIGIIDEFGVLEEGEVYCSILDHFSEIQNRNAKIYNISGQAIVTRNPCLHPADIRKVVCIDEKEITKRFIQKGLKQNLFEPYVNTVIFPMKGPIPITAMISGSDLDGDNFFICWDKRLVPTRQFKQYTIDTPEAPSASNKKEMKQVGYSQMLDFFIDYINYEKLGQIDNSHLVHADRDHQNYAQSKVCLQLAQIHGKAVDFPKTGYCPPVDPKLLVSVYPDFMEKEGADEYMSESILGILFRDVKKRIQLLLNQQKIAGQVDKDLINISRIDYEKYEIKEAFEILRQFQRDLGNLIAMVGVDTEYQIYSGNFSTAKDKVSAFGKNRLIGTIMHLRNRFAEIFFEGFPQDKARYETTNQNQLHNKEVFSEPVRKRALLFYLVSYIYKFQKFDHDSKLDGMFEKVQQVLEEYGINLHDPYELNRKKYCGFVWFVVPKIIINIKIINKKMAKLIKDEEKKEMMNEKIKAELEKGQKIQNPNILALDDTKELIINRTATIISGEGIDDGFQGQI